MKILKERSRKYKGKEYYKYKLNIPKNVLEEAGLKEGDELVSKIIDKKIILYRE